MIVSNGGVASDRPIPVSIAARKPVATEIDRGRDRLRPGGNHSRTYVDFRLICDEAVLVDQVACKLGETIAVTVTVKGRTKGEPQCRSRRRKRCSCPCCRLTFTMRHE